MDYLKKHPTAIKTISWFMPILIIFGFYLTISDPFTPGGGFQGGAALAAVLIGRYLIMPKEEMNPKILEKLEKYIFVVFVISVSLYILMGLNQSFPQLYVAYMIVMNGLLGMKVFCGLSIMFLYFILEDKA